MRVQLDRNAVAILLDNIVHDDRSRAVTPGVIAGLGLESTIDSHGHGIAKRPIEHILGDSGEQLRQNRLSTHEAEEPRDKLLGLSLNNSHDGLLTKLGGVRTRGEESQPLPRRKSFPWRQNRDSGRHEYEE